jgi:two-component system OmpR family sensor kinase
LLRSAYVPSAGTFDTTLLAQEGFAQITDTALLATLEQKHPALTASPRGAMHMMRRSFPLDIIPHQGVLYVSAHPKEGQPILFQTPFSDTFSLHVILFGVMGIALLFLYLLTLRSLRPLLPLKARIEALAEGDYTVPAPSKSKDEIGALSNAFYDTVKKIKHLKEARQLFLRNIMHELKTPLMKSKLALAMLESSPYKTKLETLLVTQEHLLEEFARIEKLGAGEQALSPKTYHIDDILAQVRDLLPDETPQLEISSSSGTLHVDFDLFCVAIKNVLDNALRYSNDGAARLTFDGKTLCISNRGPKLPHPLEAYAKPYFLGDTKQRESRGLGFGLFIALQVIALHGFTCNYEHREETSVFCITLTPCESV